MLLLLFAGHGLPGQRYRLPEVHFLYGSKPLKAYQETESKWFGGVLGGHVGIEGDSGQILNFVPNGEFHVFKKTHPGEFHSAYAIHDEPGFYRILGSDADSIKKAVIFIPVTSAQKQLFDSLSVAYHLQTPYDYALLACVADRPLMSSWRAWTYSKDIRPGKRPSRSFTPGNCGKDCSKRPMPKDGRS